MKLHLKCHSYKEPAELQFKCQDCEYWGSNELTMEVHNGRCHSETFECGLCDFKANTLENLEIHLSTCEIYDCAGCHFRVKTISEMKEHVNDEHENRNVKILHGKQDRKNCEEISSTEYLSFSLFPPSK